jgi:hypothetical protein
MFAKPKAVKLIDGSPISNLLTAPTTTAKTTGVKPPGTKPPLAKNNSATGITKKPVENKFSEELKEA